LAASVELIHGEAFFTVAHDAERPFDVHAGKGRIRDIGTAFEAR
jgi:transmembrane sensor